METSMEPLHPKKSKEDKIVNFISYLFHPLLMPTYGFAIIFFTKNYISEFTSLRSKILILSVTFIFTFIFPFINTLILLKLGRIKSLTMENNKERSVPYAGAIMYYFALFYFFYYTEIPAFFKALVLGAAISIFLTFLINFKWKISSHTVGIGGVAGVLLAVIYRLQMELYLTLMCVILIAGLVGYARLKLNAHTPTQVYTGFLLGFLVEFFSIILY